jgi:hypothetical protein
VSAVSATTTRPQQASLCVVFFLSRKKFDIQVRSITHLCIHTLYIHTENGNKSDPFSPFTMA